MDLTNKKILFLGDSITEGCGTSGGEKTFCSLIAEKHHACCMNYGIGGTRIARQSKPSAEERWDNDFCSRVSKMQRDADVIVVFGGTNDYGHGDAPIGSTKDRTPDTFYGALHTLYSSLIEKYIGTPIVVITPLHRTNEENPAATGTRKPIWDRCRCLSGLSGRLPSTIRSLCWICMQQAGFSRQFRP